MDWRIFLVCGRRTCWNCRCESGWQGVFLISLVSASGELSPSPRAEIMVMTVPGAADSSWEVVLCSVQYIGIFNDTRC